MPATSKAQQRLMGMAYAYKKGELDAKEASQEVKDLADSMTLKQLKKYASTKHEGLPDKVDDNLQPGDVGGMGPIKFPSATDVGSGDVPAGQGDAEEEYKKKRRKMKHLNTFESFVNEGTAYKDVKDKSGNTFKPNRKYKTQYGVAKFIKFSSDDKMMHFKSDEMGPIKTSVHNARNMELLESVNEEYIELPSLDEPAKDLIEAFKEWYDATATDWNSFKDDMAEDSVDEAAKNAQMEILAHLSNEMNNIIKDRKFKVRADFK